MICSRCKIKKSRKEVNIGVGWCKSCFNEYKKNWDKTPKGRLSIKKYRSSPKAKERFKEYYRKWYAKNGRDRAIDYIEAIMEWRKNHPEAIKAHSQVRQAINKGIIKKPKNCSKCKRNVRLSAHHRDYSKPLIVSWLCSSCHKLEHKIGT